MKNKKIWQTIFLALLITTFFEVYDIYKTYFGYYLIYRSGDLNARLFGETFTLFPLISICFVIMGRYPELFSLKISKKISLALVRTGLLIFLIFSIISIFLMLYVQY